MNRFCIIANREKDENLEITKRMVTLLTEQGKQVVVAEESKQSGSYTDTASIPEDTECAIVLGGDGTIIQAAHDLLLRQIPILGVNLGTLGFLTEIELSNLEQAFAELFENKYDIEHRMMIETSNMKNQSQEEVVSLRLPALNDVVVTRSGFSRIIQVGIYVNRDLVQNYRGDGVIVSTPTGSTGYNLSAGGPIVTPKTEMIVITPICPHTLNARSIIVSSEDVVEIRIRESKKTQLEEAIATIDGSVAIKLSASDRIIIKKAKQVVKLIRFDARSFFHVLRTKFGDKEE